MNPTDAKSIVIREGISENGMVVEIRGLSQFPTQERLAMLIEALEVTKAHQSGSPSIDRTLAHAIYCIGFHIQSHMDGMVAIGQEIPEEFIEDMIVIFELLEGILESAD